MKIILKNQDGSVSVLYPVLECGLTIEQIAEKDSHGTPFEIVEDSAIPLDQEFRDAWIHNGKKIEIDFVKANEITKNRLRKERQPLLESLDVEVMKNITNPVKLAEIEAQKQVLRDLPQQVDSLTTVEELKTIKAEQPAI